MLPNDTLRSLRYLLDISDAELAAIAQLADANISTEAIAAYLLNDDEEGFQPCSDEVLADALVGHGIAVLDMNLLSSHELQFADATQNVPRLSERP